MKDKSYLNMELLRFTTAGSVDDGKSTLIGRLLYDSKAIFADQMEALERTRLLRGEEHINLALLTDGLRAEREQGITIDVAYRYFATPRRKFIIADTPGHIQYTRNMVTGASTANAAIILVDARIGVLEQTIRHAFIASLLQIPHVIVCINKMDLVGFDEERFDEICDDFKAMGSKLDIQDIHFIPISALNGDNLVIRSKHTDWYGGPTLMYLLENLHIAGDHNHIDGRFPVQYVVRPQAEPYHDFRGYAGRVAGGVFKVGDPIKVLPSGFSSTIRDISTFDGPLDMCFAPQSVVLTLADDLDISRGDMIVRENNIPQIEQEIDVMICWLSEQPMVVGGKYTLRHTSAELRCIIREITYKINIRDLSREAGATRFGLNDIGRIKLRTTRPLFFDAYRKNRITGSLILVDESTNVTVCAGMIV